MRTFAALALPPWPSPLSRRLRHPVATPTMSFFITSAAAAMGGTSAASPARMRSASAWPPRPGPPAAPGRAYLSVPPTFASGTTPAVAAINARDRIGTGPWFNAKGQLIARDVAHLHNGNNLNKATALDERGNTVKGRGDTPNEHDILTGSRADGTAFAPQQDTTCGAWTKSGDGSRGRPSRPRRPLPEKLGDLVELLAPVGRLQPERWSAPAARVGSISRR